MFNPMGVKNAQDEFQWTMFGNVWDIKNVLSLSDDMIVHGFKENSREHDQALNELLQITRERNCKLNLDKLVIHTTEIQFFVHIVHKDGVKPDSRPTT